MFKKYYKDPTSGRVFIVRTKAEKVFLGGCKACVASLEACTRECSLTRSSKRRCAARMMSAVRHPVCARCDVKNACESCAPKALGFARRARSHYV